jgi:hypothetical protein
VPVDPAKTAEVSAAEDKVRSGLSGAGTSAELDQRAATSIYANKSVAAARDVHIDNAYFAHPEREIRPGSVPPERIEEIGGPYFEVTAGLRAIIDGNRDRVVILRAWAGSGRESVAIKLLLERLAAAKVDPTILKLRPEADTLRELARTGLQQASGYLLCDPPPDGLDAFTLDDLSVKLAQVDSYLVITYLTEVDLPEDDLHDYVIAHQDRSSFAAAVRGRIRFRLREDSAKAERILTRAENQSLISMDERFPLRSAADLANLIVSLASEDGSVDTAVVLKIFGDRLEEQFGNWFDRLSTDERLFAFALAVLNGLPFADIREAAEALRKRRPTGASTLSISGDQLVVGPSTSAMVDRLGRDLLHKLRAEVRTDEVRGRHGLETTEVVGFRYSGYAESTIRRMWTEQPDDNLLRWLTELIGNPSPSVRAWAAQAAGILATVDFNHVLSTLVDGWATSDEPDLREAASRALRRPATDARSKDMTFRLLKKWAGNTGNRMLQSTAAMAYGRAVSLADADLALAQLHALAREATGTTYDLIKKDTCWVALAIGEGFAAMLVNRPDLSWHVLDMILNGCLADDERAASGWLAFLTVAESVATTVTNPDGSKVRWPALLHDADNNPVVLEQLARIWVSCLRQMDIFQGAALPEEVLKAWARLADPHQEICRALADLAWTTVVVDPRVRGEWRAAAESWVDPDERNPCPNAAAWVRAAMGEG